MADWYTHSGSPSLASSGSSAVVRAEFAAVEAAFAKLPTFAGNGSKWIAVNSGATALTAITGPTLAGAFQTSSAGPITFTLTGATNVTLPTSGTIATVAGTETLSSKTLTSPSIISPFFTSTGGALTNFSLTSGTISNSILSGVTLSSPIITNGGYITGSLTNATLITPTLSWVDITSPTVSSGAFDCTASGCNIAFSSTVSSAGANTLDDYRSGYATENPTLTPAGTPVWVGYGIYYVKIGRQVWVSQYASMTSNGTSGTFRVVLPTAAFLPQSASALYTGPTYYAPGTTTFAWQGGLMTSGSRELIMYGVDTAAVGDTPTELSMLNSSGVGLQQPTLTFTYMAAT